ncbi:MAG TPA: hydroxysqualene dehydroxylase HpnE, partial [Stellaceae bacterium]|nr:hydroxysqualene dehydroxylase HpnE [Stellaceae bacterium]
MSATAPPGRVHIVGAGLAGLAASVALADEAHDVILYESGSQAGGRCRSFVDPELGVRIDNGNHLLLSGNSASCGYIERIGSIDTFVRPAEAAIPFIDIKTGEHWTLRPGRGAMPWWVLDAARRVPGTRARDYLEALRLWRAAPGDTVAAVLAPGSVLFRRLWQPLAVAALNTGVAEASAPMFWRVLAETIGRGADACRPMLAKDGLSESLVDPALSLLSGRGAEIRFGSRLRALGFEDGRVSELLFDENALVLRPEDSVILAVPAAIAARIVPGLTVPDDYAPIVNAHFRCRLPPGAPLFAGIVGGTAEWIFRKREVVSVTISAADRIVACPADELRERLWRDVTVAFGLPAAPTPPARIVKERRATFRATPAQEA